MVVMNPQEMDRVRANTNPEILERIDRKIEETIRFYATQPKEVISRRIRELDREWDMERVLETNASSLALAGTVLGLVKHRKYLLFSGTVLSFLLLHALQGWCPPVPLLRRYGIRTRSEIDREKYALKVLRGDFQSIQPVSDEPKENPASDVARAVQS